MTDSLPSHQMIRPVPTHPIEYIGPIIGALVFILLMSLVKEPARRQFNAVFLGGAMGAYISGGLGLWELGFAVLGSVVAYRGLQSYRMIGAGWLMHAAWDLVHHGFARPIWPFMETSSFGCVILDTVIAVWFLAGAPTWGRSAGDIRSQLRCSTQP